jgi:hypothetical protein
MSNAITVLHNHTSPETAYVVNDYPFGFRLRCKIRYWLEFSPRHGVRLMSQTTNPKKAGEVWNKAKGSTYCRFGGTMYLDDNNHVQWSGLHEYMDGAKTAAWVETYGAGCHPEAVPLMQKWAKAKATYDAKRAEGMDMASAGAAAAVSMVRE